MRELLPVGEYYYDKDEKSFDEAWSLLKECHETKQSIICFVSEYSEVNKAIELDYYGIKGIIKYGYITQNRLLHNEDLIGKTICVHIYNLNERKKTFVGTRLKVEQEAKRQLSSLKYGDIIEGVLKSFGNQESFALIDIKEGIQAFLSIKKVTRLPSLCCKISDYIQIGERIKGKVVFIEPEKNPIHDTYCVLSLLDLNINWADEVSGLKIGSFVSGYPVQDVLYAKKYYIEYSRNVCIDIESKKKLDKEKSVLVKITDIDYDKYKIYAEVEEDEKQRAEDKEYEIKLPDSKEYDQENSPQEKTATDKENQFSMFRRQIKTKDSPFKVHVNEAKDFDSKPNNYVSMWNIRNKIAQGQLKEEHFFVLEAVNCLVYCTSKQILSYLYCEKKEINIKNQDKLNNKLDSMVKLAMVDRFKFYSETGTGVYYVYFLNKNGHIVLQSILNKKKTSYEPGLIAKTSEEIKRRLAANQIILAYKETFDFVQNFYNFKIVIADAEVPIRPTAIIQFINSTLLIEARRRFEGWEEDLHDKMDRYKILFQNHDTQNLTYDYTSDFLKMPLYILIVCEDLEHAREVKNILFGHEMYARLFFTYDILVFQMDVNSSVFRFEGKEQDVVYYNLTELFHYNIEHRNKHVDLKEENDKNVVDEFYRIMQKSYTAGLSYLQNHNCKELQEFVQSKLLELYQIDGEGYKAAYPEDKQYFVYLLYLINHDLVMNPVASFYEGEYKWEENSSKTNDVPNVRLSPAPENKPMSSELENAVYMVLSDIEKWMKEFNWSELGMSAPLKITKHSIRQTSGKQFGYDVGMNFTYNKEEYNLGFECKSHQGEDNEPENENKTRLAISSYAYNLLQYFMYCKRENNVNNYWILICPFRDLQNNFYENLFQRWNQDIPFMQIKVFSFSQTEITCEEFLSVNDDAYRKVYKHDPPKSTPYEKQEFMKKLFFSIIDKEHIQEIMPKQLEQYPFKDEYFPQQEVMPLKTIDGEDVLEKLFQKLGEGNSVFLIGEYGSGKTYLTYLIVKTVLEHPDTYAFHPLWFKLIESFIDLETDNMGKCAINFIEQGLKKHLGFSNTFAYGGKKKILIILDGLDEIFFGLGESIKKMQFLKEVCGEFKNRYGSNVLFVITSREKDFKSCSNFQEFEKTFQTFGRIVIGDCKKDDAIEKLSVIQNSIADENNSNRILKILSQNSNLVNIARKPLYFGFLRKLILTKDILFYKDELDILKAIIHSSVQYCLNYEDCNKDLTEDGIREDLYMFARKISKQLCKGESDELIIFQKMFPEKGERNVIQLRRKNNEEYIIRFYHNAIREYLVAESLYKKMETYLYDKIVNENDDLFNWLEELDMTPETIDFFCKLTDREPIKKKQIAELLIDILKMAKKPELSGLGTHVISLLFRLQPEISGQDLSGIYANNVFLWNCSLKNINLQDAHLPNLCLFNVKLNGVDLRGADLKGLLIGTEGEVLDASHLIRNDKMIISVLYSNGQLIDYVFPDINNLESYSIMCHTQLCTKEYKNICLLENDILIHSKNNVIFLSDIEKTFNMEPGHQLIQIDSKAVVIVKDKIPYLILHDKQYQQQHIMRLPKEEYRNICIICSNLYLYIRDRKLFMQQKYRSCFIVDLNLYFECFTAFKHIKEDIITIYVKYSDDIQIIKYNLKSGEKQYDSIKLLEYHVYSKLVIISENLLYGVSRQMVFLHNLLEPDTLVKLKIKVRCQDLVLENEDGSYRVQGNTEYQMLMNSTIE